MVALYRVSQKFVPLISCTIIFDQNLFLHEISRRCLFLYREHMFRISVTGTFHKPVLDLGCLCESFLVESPISYLAFFKTILAALFGIIGLPLRFLPSKSSLFHDHFTTQHSDFPSFLAVITTDKPANRSIHAYAVT